MRWLDERESKRSLHSDISIIEWFQPHLEHVVLDQIGGDEIARLRQLKAKSSSKATANRHMALLRAILRAARDDWEWVYRIPKVPMYSIEPHGEPRFLTANQFESLANHLSPHLERMARFAVNTGLRRANVLWLRWEHVNMRARMVTVPASNYKGKKTHRVMLNKAAMAVLRTVRKDNKEWVFTYEGEPIESYKTGWRRAVKAAKLEPLRFHDLRHTWASWHVQNGTPLAVLQELGGWSDYRMVKRYAHLGPDHLQEWVNNSGTKLARSKKTKPRTSVRH